MTIKAFPIHTMYTSISQLYRLDFFLFEGGRSPYSQEGPRILDIVVGWFVLKRYIYNRAFILTLNWSAGTRPEKSVFATTGKVLFVGWCCNLNGKTLIYVSLTKRVKKSVWPFKRQCFVIGQPLDWIIQSKG